MKSYLLPAIILGFLSTLTVSAQTQKKLKNCYEEYNYAFETRGALPVPDGEHHVVYSLRSDSGCFCGEGIARVKNGKIEPFFLVMREDGTYEPAKRQLHPKMKKGEAESPNLYNIFNGMSHTFLATDYAIANLFFIEYLKRKVVANAKAPSPDDIEGVQLNIKQKEILEQAYEGLKFDFGKATITEPSYPHLNLLAQMMNENKNYKLKINGYTDNVGSAEVNLKLSKDRAKAVKDYLVKQGVDESRLTSEGFGMENPIDDNSTPMGRAFNRRVEFIVAK